MSMFLKISPGVSIPVDKIVYLKSENDKIKLITTSKKYDFRCTLIELELRLGFKGSTFIRVHNQYIINSQYIEYVEKTTSMIGMEIGYAIPIGITYYSEVIDLFNRITV